MENKPYIIPLDVPWQISAGFPDLGLKYWDVNQKVEITFVAVFLADSVNLHSLSETREKFIESYVRIDMIAGYISTGPMSVKEKEYNKYNWEKIPSMFRPHTTVSELDINKTTLEYHKHWISNNRCPMPNAYQIINSQWVHQLPNAAKLRLEHYLFLGHDIYIEILGRDWAWSKFNLDQKLSK